MTGNGTIFLGDSPGSPTTLMVLDGELTATGVGGSLFFPPSPATLSIIANSANGRINLDGSGGGGDGIVTVGRSATLDINVPMSDVFDGTINLGANSTLDISPAWTFAGGGVSDLNVNSGAGSNGSFPALPAHIAGSQMTHTGGAITLDQADETLVFDAPFVQTGGTINNSGTIVFNTNATLSGGAFSNNGGLTVNPGKTVSISNNFDIDGTGPGSATIGSGALLDLSLSGSADEIFSGVVRLNGGTLEVTTSDNHWEVDNVVTGVGTGVSTINGESVTPHNITVGASSTLQINADMSFQDFAMSVGAGSSLFLAGDVTYNQPGGTITGAGSVFPQVTTVDAGGVEVTANVYKLDLGPHTINAAAGLTLNVGNIDFPGNPASDRYDHNTLTLNGGVLHVQVADGEWELGELGVLNLRQSSSGNLAGLYGSTLRVTDGEINVDGQARIHTTVVLQEGTAITFVDDGLLEVIGPFIMVDLQGGDIIDTINRSTDDSEFDIQSSLRVSGVSTIDVERFFWDHAPTTITSTGSLSILVDEIEDTIEQQYDNTLTVNGGDLVVQLNDHEAWTLDGQMNLMNAANVAGEPIIVGNIQGVNDAVINVSGAGQTNIDAQLIFRADAALTVSAGATLSTPQRVSFHSIGASSTAQFTGGGAWLLGGIVQVNEGHPTTINMPAGTVDLDGGPADVIGNDINIDAPLVINAATMASFGNVNTIASNKIFINNGVTEFGFATGSLTVNLTNPSDSWTVNQGATIQIIGNPTPGNALDGSPLNMNGAMLVFSHAKVGSRLNIGSTGVVTIANSSSSLRLVAFPHLISGGMINGIGTLAADGNSALHGFGAINTPIDFDGNADLKAAGGTLNVNNSIINVDEIGTADTAGDLNVTNPWNTSVANALQLEGGQVRGQPITNDGLIRGFGLVAANQVINNGTIAALGGTLVLDRPGAAGYDWDGATDNGALEAVAGDLTLRATSNTTFGGSMSIGGPFDLFVEGFEIDHDASSSITLDGGVYRSNAVQRFGGALFAETGVSEIDAPGSFLLTSVNDIDATLQLRRNTSIAAGANFHGIGTLVNLDGATLTVASGASIGVTLENQGKLVLGASPGQAAADEFTQTATGIWNLEVGGTGANQFDRLTLTGEASLAGSLQLALLPGFVPALGQTFNILAAPGGVTGIFTAVNQPATMPPGLAFDVIYSPTLVQLMVAAAPIFTADFDNDGDVDSGDLAQWQGDFGVNALSDADNDGDSDGTDFLVWQRQLGSPTILPVANAVPEPCALALITLVGCGLALVRQRHP